VIVRAVAPNSRAAGAGLRANDVIVGANRVRIANLAALRNVAQAGGSLVLNVRRGDATLVILIR
jgi:serine protease DegQ